MSFHNSTGSNIKYESLQSYSESGSEEDFSTTYTSCDVTTYSDNTELLLEITEDDYHFFTNNCVKDFIVKMLLGVVLWGILFCTGYILFELTYTHFKI